MAQKLPGLMNRLQQILFKFRSETVKLFKKELPAFRSNALPTLQSPRGKRHNHYNRGYITGGSRIQQFFISSKNNNKQPLLQQGCLKKAFATPNVKHQFQIIPANIKSTFQLFSLITILAIFSGCVADQSKTKTTKTSNQKETTPKQKPNYTVPQFNADSAYAFIQKQVDFGPRVPNTPEHVACGNWLVNQFKSYGIKVQVQEASLKAFDGTLLRSKNIIAKYKPERRRRIMFCAHWDTRPFSDHDPDKTNYHKPIDGANDGGSGVAVILEAARLIAQQDVPLGIDFVLFDSEDYGQPEDSPLPQKQDSYCLGSQYWANSVKGQPNLPMYGILLDMVGGKNAIFTKEGTSMKYAPHIVKRVWNKAAELGYDSYFRNKNTKPLIDDHYYVNPIANIPTIDIIEFDATSKSKFNKHWHTQNDNMENIDRKTLKAVGQTILAAFYAEAYE